MEPVTHLTVRREYPDTGMAPSRGDRYRNAHAAKRFFRKLLKGQGECA